MICGWKFYDVVLLSSQVIHFNQFKGHLQATLLLLVGFICFLVVLFVSILGSEAD